MADMPNGKLQGSPLELFNSILVQGCWGCKDYLGMSSGFFKNIEKIQKHVTVKQAKGISGFTDNDCISKFSCHPVCSLLWQLIPTDLSDRVDIQCLTLCASAQDPCCRIGYPIPVLDLVSSPTV